MSDASIRRECPEMFAYQMGDTQPYIFRRVKLKGVKGGHVVHRSSPLTAINNIISAASFGGPKIEDGIKAHRNAIASTPQPLVPPPLVAPPFEAPPFGAPPRNLLQNARSQVRANDAASSLMGYVQQFNSQYGSDVKRGVTVEKRVKAFIMREGMDPRGYIPMRGDGRRAPEFTVGTTTRVTFTDFANDLLRHTDDERQRRIYETAIQKVVLMYREARANPEFRALMTPSRLEGTPLTESGTGSPERDALGLDEYGSNLIA